MLLLLVNTFTAMTFTIPYSLILVSVASRPYLDYRTERCHSFIYVYVYTYTMDGGRARQTWARVSTSSSA